jgi:cell wall-associated NlpC family hydrolase
VLAAVLCVLAGLLGSAPDAAADPTPSIAQAKARLAALDREAADAVEVLNGLKERLKELNAHVADRQAQVVEAQQAAGAAGDAVDDLARQAYTTGGVSGFVQALGSRTPEEFLDRVAAIGELTRIATNGLAYAQQARDSLQTQQTSLDQDQAIMSDALAATVAQRARIAAATTQTHELLASLRQAERDRIAAEAAAKRQTEMLAARAAAQGFTVYAPTGVSPEYAAKAKIAVEYMLSQVGGTYSMNAQPPKTWDCSKLTAYAWGRAGVSLVPYSYTQWQQTQRVPQDQLQPGDLLFYFEKGAHHVEMYIGNGMAVSASNPGVGVELQTDPFGGWYGDHYTGAGRVVLAG